MTFAAVFSAVAGALSLLAAAFFAPFARLPRWRKHKNLVPVALTAAAYVIADGVVTTSLPDPAIVWSARVQLCAGALHAVSWIRYAEDDLGPLPNRVGVFLRWLLWAFAAGALLPGLVFSDQVVMHPFWDLVYHDAVPTSVAAVLFAALLCAVLVAAVWYADAAIRGVPHGFSHFLALLFVLVTGVNDSIVSFGTSPMPYLLDFGLLGEVMLVSLAMSRSWARDLGALAALGGRRISNPSNPAQQPASRPR